MAVAGSIKKMKGSFLKDRSKEQAIDFTYYAPDAKKVYLAGKFNDWNVKSHPMKKGSDGIWRLSVRLPVGRHEYKFFVDGEWAQQIPCSTTAFNPYGTYNCVIGVS